MLEGILAGVIERLAGKYVDGIDKRAAGVPFARHPSLGAVVRPVLVCTLTVSVGLGSANNSLRIVQSFPCGAVTLFLKT
jgi:hypothetical protein